MADSGRSSSKLDWLRERVATIDASTDHRLVRDWIVQPLASAALNIGLFARSTFRALIKPTWTFRHLLRERSEFTGPASFLATATVVAVLLDRDLETLFGSLAIDFESWLPGFAEMPLQVVARVAGWLSGFLLGVLGVFVFVWTVTAGLRLLAGPSRCSIGNAMAVVAYASGLFLMSIPACSYLMYVVAPQFEWTADFEFWLTGLITRLLPIEDSSLVGRSLFMMWMVPWSLIYVRAAAVAIGVTPAKAIAGSLLVSAVAIAILVSVYFTMTGLV